jgi:hypothetical protein
MHDPEYPVTNPPMTDTDLPLSPGGNNGNSVGAPGPSAGLTIARLLEEALEPLPEPRYEWLDEEAVHHWLERATAHVTLRRHRQQLLREAMRVLDENWRTAMASERLREQAERQRERLFAMQQPGYWKERDSRRRATRAVHVVVDPLAWNGAKAAAAARQSSVGVVVGELVAAQARRTHRWAASRDGNRETVRLFARLALDDDAWRHTRALAADAKVTAERLVGMIVEDAVQRRSGALARRSDR